MTVVLLLPVAGPSPAAGHLHDQGHRNGSSDRSTTSGTEPVTATNLPAEFWEARPALHRLRQAAHSRARSADAVLGVVMARVCTATPREVCLPPIVGSAGSLNLAVALIAGPGGGKSTAKRIGAELIDLTDKRIVDDLAVGSGEGLIESYFELVTERGDDGKMTKVKRQTKHSVFAYLDEGQALGEMGSRKGATLLPTLRSAWTGDTLGQANASEDRRRRLGAGTVTHDASGCRLACVVHSAACPAAPTVDVRMANT